MKTRVFVFLLLTALVLTACASPAASALAAPAPKESATPAPKESATPAPKESAAPAASPSRLEKLLAACDGYAFPQADGVKYWLDTADGLKLHCWMISGDPTYYEKVYTADLDKAAFRDGVLTIPELTDRQGFPMRSLRELRLAFGKDKVTVTADVDEKLLAGGAGDNLLGGEYVFVPWEGSHTAPVKLTAAEPFGELILPANGYASVTNGVIRFWLDTADGIRLHFWHKTEVPEYEDLVYTVPPEKAGRHGDWITAPTLLDAEGKAVPGLRAVSFLFREGSVLMSLTTDPAPASLLPQGQFQLFPYSGSYVPPVINGSQPEVSAYDGYTCTEDGEVLFWLESQGARLNLTLHCFFSDGGARYERVYAIDSEKAYFVGDQLIVQDLLDWEGNSVWEGRYSAIRFSFGADQVLMRVETADPVAEEVADCIPAGDYFFTPAG